MKITNMNVELKHLIRQFQIFVLPSILIALCSFEQNGDKSASAALLNDNVNSASAAIGSGWNDITNIEESQQKIQLENYHSPSLDNIATIWSGRGTLPYYMEADFDTLSNFNSNVTAGYMYAPSSLTHTFNLYKYPGSRSEIRIFDEYSSGSRQFEGYVTINNKTFGSAVFQLFGSATGATQMQIRADSRTDGGRLYINYDNSKNHSGSTTIATGIIDQELRINVIHLQENAGNRVYVFVNGVEKFWFEDSETPTRGSNYMKYGCYGRENDPSTNSITDTQVKWRAVKLWKDGTRATSSNYK